MWLTPKSDDWERLKRFASRAFSLQRFNASTKLFGDWRREEA